MSADSAIAAEQEEELAAVQSIYEDCFEIVNNEIGKKEALFRLKIEFDDDKPLHVSTGCECKEVTGQGEVFLRVLPPVTLRVQLPANYPMEAPPRFGLSCLWLSRESLRKLKCRFEELWTEAANSGVLFSIISFLQTEMLDYLHVSSDEVFDLLREFRTIASASRTVYGKQESTDLTVEAGSTSVLNDTTLRMEVSMCSAEPKSDIQSNATERFACEVQTDQQPIAQSSCSMQSSSATVSCSGDVKSNVQSNKPRCLAIHGLLQTLQEFDAARREAEFANARVECGVCCEVYFGHEAVRVDKCGHIFCVECLRQYVETRVAQNDVVTLQCAAHACETQLPHAVIRRVVSTATYERFERLLLEASLATMTDLVYCPRPVCNQPVLTEPSSNMAICSSCSLVFCSFCFHSFHGVAPCSLKLDKLSQLRDAYLKSDADMRKQLEARHGKQLIRQAVEEMASVEWLRDNAKPCPHCGFSVQKLDGCNKMTCTKCGSYFCWLCGAKLNKGDPYAHYRDGSSCAGQLFLGVVANGNDEDDDWDEDFEDSDEDDGVVQWLR